MASKQCVMMNFKNDLCSKQSICSANKILKSTCAANNQPVQQTVLEISSYVAAKNNLCG